MTPGGRNAHVLGLCAVAAVGPAAKNGAVHVLHRSLKNERHSLTEQNRRTKVTPRSSKPLPQGA